MGDLDERAGDDPPKISFNRVGRPPLPSGVALTKQKIIRLRPGEFTEVFRAAVIRGRPMASFMRESVVRVAREVLRDGRRR